MKFYVAGRRTGWKGVGILGASLLILGGCDESGEFSSPFKSQSPEAAASDSESNASPSTVKLVERDVEAPKVFQETDRGLWDGRPSLGGVWVAHPDVNEPERVIIRNVENSKFVIGALFRRERDNPGPVFQVSSDAADALGMLAGAPVELNVTALRRESEPTAEPAALVAETETLSEPQEIEATALEPIAGAAAAIDAAESAEVATAVVEPEPLQPRSSTLDKPFIQIGIFSVEQNAKNTATAMRQEGMVPVVKKQSSQGKTFWRVLVGPASTKSERTVLLKKIKSIGFDDAYPVTN